MNIPPPPELDLSNMEPNAKASLNQLRNWCEELYRVLQFPSFHNAFFGTVASSNYATFNTEGQLAFTGTAGITMTMKVPSTLTLDAGTAAGETISELQTLNDGNEYHIDEASATPGIDLKCNFTSVKRISQVFVQAYYNGSASHTVSLQLYNYTDSQYDTIGVIPHVITMGNFFIPIPDDTDYISGENAIVRFNHTQNGDAAHDLYIDYVAIVT